MELNYHGNKVLLKLAKTAFLCSRKVPASVVLKCYDWAIEQREKGNCVISGFHSQIEKDVLHYLLKGDQPIIIAMPRVIKQILDPGIKEGIEKGRLLIVSPFSRDVIKITNATAMIRNQLMIELADTITIGFMNKGGNLEKLLKQTKKEVIKIV